MLLLSWSDVAAECASSLLVFEPERCCCPRLPACGSPGHGVRHLHEGTWLRLSVFVLVVACATCASSSRNGVVVLGFLLVVPPGHGVHHLLEGSSWLRPSVFVLVVACASCASSSRNGVVVLGFLLVIPPGLSLIHI